jgi:hypothetical protein
MRVEGQYWNAYYAMADTMKDAIFLGSIALRFVEDETRKQVFMALMQEAVSDLVEEFTGERLTWPDDPIPAPEHERGGST